MLGIAYFCIVLEICPACSTDMKAIYSKHFLLTVILCCALGFTVLAQGPLAVNYSEDNGLSYSPEDISDHLRSLPDPLVRPHYNHIVASYIKTYTVKNRDRTQQMLGRMEHYFPLFEKHLIEADLPLSLKYVPVLESALDPMATSRSGAAGMWQIMPITAKDMKLRVSRYVDDRRDPEKSTKAAVAYLKKLYKRFGSWELALAAYNGGPGRVSRAIRRTGLSDFEDLKKHLPRETRNYVSAFLSANYIANYYHQYDLQPIAVDDRFYNTQMVEVSQLLRFSEVAAIAGADEALIQQLNPRYPKGHVPERSAGHLVRLPALEAAILKNRMGLSGYTAQSIAGYQQLHYEVQPTDNFAQLCGQLSCSPAAVARWNGLESIQLMPGQVITYFKPQAKRPQRKKYTTFDLLQSKNSSKAIAAPMRKAPVSPAIEVTNFVFKSMPGRRSAQRKVGRQNVYVVQAGESLISIAKSLPNVSLQELMEWNELGVHSIVRTGRILLLK